MYFDVLVCVITRFDYKFDQWNVVITSNVTEYSNSFSDRFIQSEAQF